MPRKQIHEVILACVALALSGGAGAQAAAPTVTTAAPAVPVSSAQTYTLGQLADMQRDIEFEKQRRALREAKGIDEKPAVLPTVMKKVKTPPKPVVPEGLQVRAIFGVKPVTTIRFYTASGQFEDRQIGDAIQGWIIVDVKNEWVTLRKGTVTYPLALQMRSVDVESVAIVSEQSPGARNVVQAGALPSPKL